jgi:hypothetical protein
MLDELSDGRRDVVVPGSKRWVVGSFPVISNMRDPGATADAHACNHAYVR